MKINDFFKLVQRKKLDGKKMNAEEFLNHSTVKQFVLSFPSIRSKIEAVYRAMDRREESKVFPTQALNHICLLLGTVKDPIKKPGPKPKESKPAILSDRSSGTRIKASEEDPEEDEPKTKPYSIILYDSVGNGNFIPVEEKEIVRHYSEATQKWVNKEKKANFFTAETYQEAEGIALRRLDKRENGTHVEIIGHGVKNSFTRTEAQRVLRERKKGPSTKTMVKYQSSLGNSMRCHQHKVHFSGC